MSADVVVTHFEELKTAPDGVGSGLKELKITPDVVISYFEELPAPADVVSDSRRRFK